MNAITIVIVEDSNEFSDGLKGVLESQTFFPCKVHVLNPADKSRATAPTTENAETIEKLAQALSEGELPSGHHYARNHFPSLAVKQPA